MLVNWPSRLIHRHCWLFDVSAGVPRPRKNCTFEPLQPLLLARVAPKHAAVAAFPHCSTFLPLTLPAPNMVRQCLGRSEEPCIFGQLDRNSVAVRQKQNPALSPQETPLSQGSAAARRSRSRGGSAAPFAARRAWRARAPGQAAARAWRSSCAASPPTSVRQADPKKEKNRRPLTPGCRGAPAAGAPQRNPCRRSCCPTRGARSRPVQRRRPTFEALARQAAGAQSPSCATPRRGSSGKSSSRSSRSSGSSRAKPRRGPARRSHLRAG